MTDSDKIRFLKSEGWLGKYLGGRLIKILDPIYGDSYRPEDRRALDKAVSIARRRKSARDTRRLKKTGFEIRILGDGRGNVYRDWYRQGTDSDAEPFDPGFSGTKAEALATLGEA